MSQSESARRSLSQIEASLSFFHRANLQRYRKLLGTNLSDRERMTVHSRLVEEEAALRRLDSEDAF